jgi:hypothetical protein
MRPFSLRGCQFIEEDRIDKHARTYDWQLRQAQGKEYKLHKLGSNQTQTGLLSAMRDVSRLLPCVIITYVSSSTQDESVYLKKQKIGLKKSPGEDKLS